MPHKTIEARRAYKRFWYSRNKERHIASLDKSPETRKKYRDREVPEVKLARWRLWEAIENGKIARPKTCSRCGAPCVPHGHHHDYSKPLSVTWLCPPCHGMTRRKDWKP